MKSRKTLSSWLSNKYLLVIRNEEDFAEKTTFSFTYAKIILLIVLLFIMVFFVNLYLVNTVLSQWFNPQHEQIETNKRLVELALKLDSLEYEVEIKDQYIHNIGRILSGQDTLNTFEEERRTAEDQTNAEGQGNQFDKNYARIDSQFRQEFEQVEQTIINTSDQYAGELTDVYFFTPVNGIVTSKFNAEIQHFGVDVVAQENEPIKSIADGTVILSSWTQDGGYVIGIQHRANLISIYKHNSFLLKKTGSFVSSGEVIAIIGNTGELTTGPHLHFELWYNGNPVNPEDFVSF